MYVQGVDNVYELNFNGREGNDRVSYGDIFLQAEQEYSRHNFEHADTEMLKRHFEDAERECTALLGAGEGKAEKGYPMALPAYDQCIKASHVFNLLDARGVISVTERQSYILRVRNLAKSCGAAWLQTTGGGPGMMAEEGAQLANGGEARPVNGEDRAVQDAAPAPRTSMLFSASNWTFNVRLGRNGREEGEGIIIMGEVTYRTATGERRVSPARVMVVKPDGNKQLEALLGSKETVITIPLEPLPMQRLKERLIELVAHHGMTLRVAFSATDSDERQPVEAVDFAFSSAGKPLNGAQPRPG
jgi:hypothetical protein